MSLDGSAEATNTVVTATPEDAKKAVENLSHGIVHTALTAILSFFEKMGIKIDDEVVSIVKKLEGKL